MESTDNTLAIVAVLATMVAAIGGAIVTAVASHLRQRKELNAAAERLNRELDAAYERQERQLAHDRAVRDDEELARLEAAGAGWVTRFFPLIDRLDAAYRVNAGGARNLSQRTAPWLVLAAVLEEILSAALALKLGRRQYLRRNKARPPQP